MIFGKHKERMVRQKQRKPLQWHLRRFVMSCQHRHFSWLFIIIFVGTTIWMVLLWHRLFYGNLLLPEDVERIRLKYAGTTFDAPAFRAVVERAQERRAAFDAASPHVARDIFFSKRQSLSEEKAVN